METLKVGDFVSNYFNGDSYANIVLSVSVYRGRQVAKVVGVPSQFIPKYDMFACGSANECLVSPEVVLEFIQNNLERYEHCSEEIIQNNKKTYFVNRDNPKSGFQWKKGFCERRNPEF